jgi:hypothetical protein
MVYYFLFILQANKIDIKLTKYDKYYIEIISDVYFIHYVNCPSKGTSV